MYLGGAADCSLEHVDELALVVGVGDALEAGVPQRLHEAPQVIVATVLDECSARLQEASNFIES